MSARRKVPVFGWAIGGPVIASTSSGVSPAACISWSTVIIACTPMRLPMKFGVSLPTTMPLPSASSPKRLMRSTVCRSVSGPATISRSFM